MGTHYFTPFKDARPDVPPGERHQAVGGGIGRKNTLHAFESADELRWSPISAGPVFTEGRFDSKNLDANRGRYRCYFRNPYQEVRGIGVVESDDFRRWADPRLITLDPPTTEHLYTNATIPYFRNPALCLAFPKRYFPQRRRLTALPTGGIPEAVMLCSRDGLHYEFNTAHMPRDTLQVDGFASDHAGYAGGELVTTPLSCDGRRQVLNFATGAGGSVRVGMQAESGAPLSGFELADGQELYGDAIAEPYGWNSGSDLSVLAGRRVRIRFALKDRDLDSYRCAP